MIAVEQVVEFESLSVTETKGTVYELQTKPVNSLDDNPPVAEPAALLAQDETDLRVGAGEKWRGDRGGDREFSGNCMDLPGSALNWIDDPVGQTVGLSSVVVFFFSWLSMRRLRFPNQLILVFVASRLYL